MEKSTSKVEVVPIKLEPHSNSDTLSIVRVFGGYPVIVKTQDWVDKEIGVYIPPDSIVNPKLPEFAFLDRGRELERVRVIKLRGIISMGLLVPAPEGSKLGDDVTEILQVQHYEPEEDLKFSVDNEKAPKGFWSKYDIDLVRKYHKYLDGVPTAALEKVHGSNMRLAWDEDRLWVGSRSYWKSPDAKDSVWWRIPQKYPQIEKFCKAHPNHTLYGELLGLQCLKYGFSKGNPGFLAFDVHDKAADKFWPVHEMLNRLKEWEIPTVPVIDNGFSFSLSEAESMAEGPSLVQNANHVREGVVLRPLEEIHNDKIGRLILKLVGNGYYQKT